MINLFSSYVENVVNPFVEGSVPGVPGWCSKSFH